MAKVEIQFDPAFVEEVVFLELKRLAALGEDGSQKKFRQGWASLYGAKNSIGEREAAFQQLADRTFQALGFSELFAERLEEFPAISAHVELALVRPVFSRKEERVEFYVHNAGSHRLCRVIPSALLIGLRVTRCLERETLIAFLRHELMHVSDMVDPAFQYDPSADLGGACGMEEELIRERFRLLWDVWVHGRSNRKGWQTLVKDSVRRQEWERAFASLDPLRRQELFRKVRGLDHWTQQEFLALAREERLTQATGFGGTRCPLCHFPTQEGVRDWSGERSTVAQRIRVENDGWDTAQGACLQCFELYRYGQTHIP